MHNKKIFSIAIIAVLTSLCSHFAAPALALNVVPTLHCIWQSGDKINVSGAAGAADSFATITVFWDTLGTPIATGFAAADGSYLIRDVVIPAATITAGNTHHYVIVNDGNAATGVKYTEFSIVPKITISTTPKTSDSTYDAKVLPGDSLSITGAGFAGTTSQTTVTVALKLVKGAVETPLVATITTNSTGHSPQQLQFPQSP